MQCIILFFGKIFAKTSAAGDSINPKNGLESKMVGELLCERPAGAVLSNTRSTYFFTLIRYDLIVIRRKPQKKATSRKRSLHRISNFAVRVVTI